MVGGLDMFPHENSKVLTLRVSFRDLSRQNLDPLYLVSLSVYFRNICTHDFSGGAYITTMSY